MNEVTVQPEKETSPGRPVYGLLAEFEDVLPLLEASAQVRDAGYTRWDTYSPIPIHGLDEAMGVRRTRLPWVVFGAGLFGGLSAFALQWWMNGINYAYVVSGKPLLSVPAFIPIIFEVTILLAAIMAFVGMIAFNRLPRLYNAFAASRAFATRVTTDRFFIGIEARDPKFDEAATRRLLEAAGAVRVERIEVEPDGPLPERVRKYALPAAVVLAGLALVPPFLIARARVTPSGHTRVQAIPDMDEQRKYMPQDANALFADTRAMRPLVPGVVAVGTGLPNRPLNLGIENEQWVTGYPVPVTAGLLERGQQRFDIFCATCHGLDGGGNGPVAATAATERVAANSPGWVAPTNLHDAVVRDRPNGHIFNTITNGIRTMPAYGMQVPVADRWAIVAYVRALQVSQAAPIEAVPAEQRRELR